MNINSKKSLFAALFFFFSSLLFAFNRPLVTNIKSDYANGNKINITWTNPDNLEIPVTKYLIYRSLKPLTFFSDVNKAEFLAVIPGNSTGYTDTVKDLNDYYYAVISFTDECLDLIMPAMNATVQGVHIEAEKQVNPSAQRKNSSTSAPLRGTPLPYLDLVEGMSQSESVISDEARSSAASLGNTKGKKAEITYLEPYFFEKDMIAPERGDAYYLFQILSQYFAPRNYAESISQLKKLTGRNISEDVEHRSYFYLGEAYYFSDDFEEAVRTFVKVQDIFPEESKKWLESSLDLLQIQPEL